MILKKHFNLAAIYYENNEVKRAIKHYKTVTKRLIRLEEIYLKAPSLELKTKIERFQNARIRLADYYMDGGQITPAYDLINRLPISIEKYELLAKYYEASKQPSAAISILKQLNDRLDTNMTY